MKKRLFFAGLTLLWIGLLGASRIVNAETVRNVVGTVSDIRGDRVEGAKVAVVRDKGGGGSFETTRDGEFILRNVSQESVIVEIQASEYRSTEIVVPAGESTAVVAAVLISLESLERSSSPPTADTRVASTRDLSGKIFDPDSSELIIGATITVVGSDIVAFSDENGEYMLPEIPAADILVEVDAPGYGTKQFAALAGTRSLNLEFDADGADVAFFSSGAINIAGREPVLNKANLANGASVVNDIELNRVSAQTVEAALVGKVAGANIQQNSGAPGGGAQIRFRGISTINGQSRPLVVVDGVIISNVETAAFNSIEANGTNRLADLNPNDIQSVEVLKGAAAGALYGSKAANGVIVISTKQGVKGPPVVAITQRVGLSQLSNKLGHRVFTSEEEVMDAFGPAGVAVYNANNGQSFDLEEQMAQTSLATETIANVSGGGENNQYYSSLLIRDQPGVIKGTFYEKQSGRVNATYKLGDRVTLAMSGNLLHTVSNRGLTNNIGSLYAGIIETPSFVDLRRQENGSYPDNPFSYNNPLETIEFQTNREEIWRFISSANLGVKAWSDAENDISVNWIAGVDQIQQKAVLLSPPNIQGQAETPLPGSVDDTAMGILNYNAGVNSVWRHQPVSGAFVSAFTLGFTHEVADSSRIGAHGENLVNGQNRIGGATVQSVGQALFRTVDQGLFAQEELAFFNKKLRVLGALLAERSSLNGDANALYYYPKAAVTYTLPPVEGYVDTLRIRGAYGQAGNRPDYGQKYTPFVGSRTISGAPSLTLPFIVGASDIEPERHEEFEFGVDLISADQNITLEVTGYQKNVSNLLLDRQLPGSTGFVAESINGGAIRNRGGEIALTLRPLELIPFVENPLPVNWTTRGILTRNRSQVIRLADGVEPFDVNPNFGNDLGAYRIEPGKSLTQIVASIGDQGVIPVGDGEPDFRVGWANKFEVGRVTVSSLVDWQQGSEALSISRLDADISQISPDFVTEGVKRLDTYFQDADIRPYIEDASFVKLREVAVNYQLNKYAIGVSGRNLLTFTNYSGLDPEVSNFGSQPIARNYDVGPYPPSRSYWFSVSATY